MTSNSIESAKAALLELNRQIAVEEQRGEEATGFFQSLLSEQLLFRRANGKVVGKSGTDGFLDGLKNNPFSERKPSDICVTLLDDRALVTLVVVGTRKDGSVHRYRNIRLFARADASWLLECWYNYEIV